MMSAPAKTALAVVVAGVTTVLQVVVSFTRLGERIGIERTIGITGAGIFVVAFIVFWVATVDLTKRRRLIGGIGASFLAIAITVILLSLTYRLHNILITQARRHNITTTIFRGALTSTDATISFYADPGVPILLKAIDSHDREGVNAVRIEQTSETDFTFHSFQYPQMITFTHESARPTRLLLDTDSTVTFMTFHAGSRHIRADLVRGGILWFVASAFIWWLSRSSRPSDRPKRPAGIHMTG